MNPKSLSTLLVTFYSKTKQNKKEGKNKKIVVTEKKVNHENQTIFTSPLTFNRIQNDRRAHCKTSDRDDYTDTQAS